ncbi:MAG: DUF4340 domain-containing protein [bacterium]
MKWGRIALYWALAVGIAVYLQWGGSTSPFELEPPATETSAPLLEGPANRIDRVEITAGRQHLVCERIESRWKLIEPRGLAVSNDLIEATLETLTSTPPIESIPADDVELSDFGLDPPALAFRAWAGERDLGELLFGDRNPTRTAAYAGRKGDAKVYVIGLSSRYYTELLLDEVALQRGPTGQNKGSGP